MDVDENHSNDLSTHSEQNPTESEEECKDNGETSESKSRQSEIEKNTKNKRSSRAQQKSKKKAVDNAEKQKKGRSSAKSEEINADDEANDDSEDGKKSSEDTGDTKTVSADETSDKQDEKKKEKGGRKATRKSDAIKEDQGKAEEKSSKTLDSNVPMMDDPNLPSGWYRKVVQRRTGKTAGQFDVYLYSPEGKKFRSRFELITYLVKTHSPLKADDFDFTVRGKNNTTSRSTSKPFTSVLSKKKMEKKKDLPKKSNVTKSPIKKTPRKPKRRLVVKLGVKSNQKRHVEEDKTTEKQNADSPPLKKAKIEVKKATIPIKHKKELEDPK